MEGPPAGAAPAAQPPPQPGGGGGKARFGYEQAGIISRLTYHFVEPLIRAGVRQEITERTSYDYLPSADRAEKLAADFEAAYAAVQVHSGGPLCVLTKGWAAETKVPGWVSRGVMPGPGPL